MAEEEKDVNCIGYASLRMGFDVEERFIHPSSLEQVLVVHDEVPNMQSAEVVGVVRAGGNDYHTGPTVCHMAVVEPDGTISHREKYGEEVSRHVPFEVGLEGFLKRPEDFRVIYLIRKRTD